MLLSMSSQIVRQTWQMNKKTIKSFITGHFRILNVLQYIVHLKMNMYSPLYLTIKTLVFLSYYHNTFQIS